jgi:hypothetical protein
MMILIMVASVLCSDRACGSLVWRWREVATDLIWRNNHMIPALRLSSHVCPRICVARLPSPFSSFSFLGHRGSTTPVISFDLSSHAGADSSTLSIPTCSGCSLVPLPQYPWQGWRYDKSPVAGVEHMGGCSCIY